jgi:hypothetical protein
MTRKFVVRCELGHRLYTEQFTKDVEAAGFIRLVLGNEAIRKEGVRVVTAKGGVLRIFCHQMDELLDIDDVMPPGTGIKGKVEAFLRGKWDIENLNPMPRVNGHKPAGLVTLSDICARHKWKPRIVRAALREAKVKKPASGSWSWPSNEAKKVEATLTDLMK